ncbi:hypothetical protein PIB30_043150 [Stylosanthes scabra]|uniref:Uncharacterized protein n=1 Tax=Stylosanthes scabra TaxID=79078 RepID=A0ABU6ZE65_9FABA|nr:hypothetical protein [Stylosanthes scabra]
MIFPCPSFIRTLLIVQTRRPVRRCLLCPLQFLCSSSPSPPLFPFSLPPPLLASILVHCRLSLSVRFLIQIQMQQKMQVKNSFIRGVLLCTSGVNIFCENSVESDKAKGCSTW